MLEQMRRSSQSLLIYLMFGIVIAVFIVNFGPQSPTGGCGGQQGIAPSASAAKVDGRVVGRQQFQYGYILLGGGQFPAQAAKQMRLKESVMDKLIERELLAREAERMGIRVGEEEVQDFLADSKLMALGREQSFKAVEKDGKFDYDLFRRFVQIQFGMSPRSFIDEQRRELLAARMRDVLRGSVNVSVDEVRSEFERRENQVNVEYLRLAARRYEGEVDPSAKDIESHAAANEKKLKELYDQRKFLYEKAPKERKLRQILVKTDAGATAEAESAAQKKAEALLARLRKGESFSAVAKAASEDPRSKTRGGDIGWRRQGATMMGAAVDEKAWAAKDGEVVGPLKGDGGFYLVVAEATREGDIPFDKARSELAEDQLRQELTRARAKTDAEAALAKAKAAAGKTLKELFPAAQAAKDKGGDATTSPPEAEETGLFSRRGAVVEGIGTSPELAKAVFALTSEAPLAGPIEVSGSYVIVRLKERKQADMTDFEKRKIELLRGAALAKGEQIVSEWAQRRCMEAKDAKKIDVTRDYLRYEGPEATVAYEPCNPARF